MYLAKHNPADDLNTLRLLNFDDLLLLAMMSDPSVRLADLSKRLNIDRSAVLRRIRKIGYVFGDGFYQWRGNRRILSDVGMSVSMSCRTFIEDLSNGKQRRSYQKTTSTT